ncbi:Mitochondrial carrier protein ymc2 [Blyttiomyces sp. JEL0837]|nr:Mitochondrial carrier protein ymc2 [Blyttiomyces sp. JEL0837]
MAAVDQKKKASGGAMQTIKELFAGSVGGIVQVLTGQPFDTVKVRLQTQPDKYTSMVDCVRKTYSQEGLFAFYKGTLTPLIGIGACVSIQFGALEAAKRNFAAANKARTGKPSNQFSLLQLYLAGAFSGTANSVLSGPIEHVRIRLQVQSGASTGGEHYKGPVDLFKKVYKSYGIAGIYKGQAITLLREFHGYGIYFLTYEWLIQERMKAQKTTNRGDVAAWRQCLYGAASGYTLWVMIYPIDVIKSKLQTDSFDVSKRKYSGSWDCFKKVVATDGVNGLYRGFWTCMLRAGPANAATFVAYEATMSLIGR